MLTFSSEAIIILFLFHKFDSAKNAVSCELVIVFKHSGILIILQLNCAAPIYSKGPAIVKAGTLKRTFWYVKKVESQKCK